MEARIVAPSFDHDAPSCCQGIVGDEGIHSPSLYQVVYPDKGGR